MVERRHPACERVGRLERERAGHAEAEMPGDLRHRRDYQDRIIERYLDAIPERGVDVATIDVVHPEHVGDEQAVEAAALKDLRELAPVLQVGVVDGTIARMSPKACRLMHHAVHVERVETNLFGHGSLP